MTALQDWISIRALIADERNWCQRAFFFTSDGRRRQCLYNAMIEATDVQTWHGWPGDHSDGWPADSAERFHAVASALAAANPGLITTNVPQFNDKNPHPVILAAVDRTIAYLRRQEAIDQLKSLGPLQRTESHDDCLSAVSDRMDRANQEFLKRCQIKQGE